MKKQALILVSIMLAAVMTACGNSPDRSGSDADKWGSAPESTAAGGITYKGSASGETFLKGLDGKPIEVSEIDSLADKNYEPTAVLDENNFGHAECNGFAYVFEPSVFFEESEDPELFDNGYYTGEKGKPVTEFMRVNVGDKFNGLTVKSARAVFSTLNTDLGDGYYYEGSEIKFDGEITLTGWLSIPSVDEKYPNVILDMSFYCDNEKKLPLSVDFVCNPKFGGYYHIPRETIIGIYTDIPQISLGKYPDYDIDFQGLKEGDAWVKAEITVTDVKMICGIQGDGGHVTAKLGNIKLM